MALQRVVSSLDDLPETHRPLYVENGDGRYRLDLEQTDDDRGMRAARDDERKRRKTAEQELKRIKHIEEKFGDFEDADPDLLRQLLTDHQKGQRKKMIEEDRLDEYVDTETKKRTAKMQEDNEAEKKGYLERISKLEGRLTKLKIDNVWPQAASKLGLAIRPGALEDVISRGRQRFTYDVEEDSMIAKNGDEIIYGKDGQTSQTPEEFLEELKKSASHLFEASTGGGATKPLRSVSSGAAPRSKAFGAGKILEARGLR